MDLLLTPINKIFSLLMWLFLGTEGAEYVPLFFAVVVILCVGALAATLIYGEEDE